MASLLTFGASLIPAIYQRKTGKKQIGKAEEALEELEGQEPEIEVPAAFKNIARDPVGSRTRRMQEETAARRTSQTVGALQTAGTRGVLGGLSRAMDAERGFERERTSNYQRQRIQAQRQLGQAEQNVQRRRMQNYLSKVNAARQALQAGQQNVMGGLSSGADAVTNFAQSTQDSMVNVARILMAGS